MEVLTLATPPAVEPVTLAEAKLHLRLDIDDDDALVSALIVAARIACETLLRQSFITTGWVLHLDSFPYGGGYFNRTIRQMGEGPMWLPQSGGGVFRLPRPPLVSVEAITYIDTNSTVQTIDPSLYRASGGSPGRVQPVLGKVWPIAAPVIDAVQIAFTAGYGADGSHVPEPIKLAMKLLLSHYYEDREASDDIPPGVASLLASVDHGSYA